jgi:uncharacterized repeat protein (TIGR03837 family)
VLVTAGRAAAAARHATRLLPPLHQVSLTYLPTLTQVEYDQLLWACDLNGVRGEDSLVRAIWAGKPLLWQIYPQHDAAHIDKLNAFLDVLNASDSLRAIHHAWNGTDPHRQHGRPTRDPTCRSGRKRCRAHARACCKWTIWSPNWSISFRKNGKILGFADFAAFDGRNHASPQLAA